MAVRSTEREDLKLHARRSAPAALVLALALSCVGCGYTARDAHLAQRSVAVGASPGDGTLVVVRPQSAWGEDAYAATRVTLAVSAAGVEPAAP